jgi:hypothetical protein
MPLSCHPPVAGCSSAVPRPHGQYYAEQLTNTMNWPVSPPMSTRDTRSVSDGFLTTPLAGMVSAP